MGVQIGITSDILSDEINFQPSIKGKPLKRILLFVEDHKRMISLKATTGTHLVSKNAGFFMLPSHRWQG